MPTIAIDYTPAIRQSAGIGRIIRHQVRALLALNIPFDIRLFVAGPVSSSQRQQAPLPLHATAISERNMVRLWHRFNCPIPLVEWFTGGPLALFHATDFVLAPSRARRKMVTVHDLAFLFYPDAAMPSLHRYLNVVVPRSVHRADHIVADSYHTARDLEEQWHIAQEHITVVQGAVDQTHFCIADDFDKQDQVRQKYGIGEGPFLLGLSTLQPRKNFARLIEAFHLARQESGMPHRLVIGGGKGWLYDEIYARIQQLKLGDHVLLPGFIDDGDLPALYRAAAFFAFPSLYEGFGIPILEAQACGTPVLTADNSCLPEAAGTAAVYVQATNTESIARGIVQLAQDAGLRQRLRQEGLANAARFTWERSARQLFAAYEKLL